MIKRWKELSREEAFKKYSWLIQKRIYKLPSGEEADFYIRYAKSTVCILAITKENKVITAKQYRPGPDQIYNELPGGFLDESEDPKEAALRELKEETGYSGDIVWVGRWQDDAYTERQRSVVVATNCRKTVETDLDSSEFAETELLELKDFVSQVRKGELTDTAGALLGLDYLGLLK